MDHFSIVAQMLIVAGTAFVGPVVVFLGALLVAILLRSIRAVTEPAAIAFTIAGRIGWPLPTSLRGLAGGPGSAPAVSRAS